VRVLVLLAVAGSLAAGAFAAGSNGYQLWSIARGGTPILVRALPADLPNEQSVRAAGFLERTGAGRLAVAT
jgi:hypothetical protein